MTLICSHITKYGIVMASDSNLSNDRGNVGFGQKIFPIPKLNSCIAFSGVYSVNNTNMDDYLNDFIQSSIFTSNTLEDLANDLANRFNSEMTSDELKYITIIHLCGCFDEDYKEYVKHIHISNCVLLEDGNYQLRTSGSFGVKCDFNSLTNLKDRETLKNVIESASGSQYYINGFPPGRIAYKALFETLFKLYTGIWNVEQWEFHEPKNIFETSFIIKHLLETIGKLFQLSNYNALYIGGEIQTYLIPFKSTIDTFIEKKQLS